MNPSMSILYNHMTFKKALCQIMCLICFFLITKYFRIITKKYYCVLGTVSKLLLEICLGHYIPTWYLSQRVQCYSNHKKLVYLKYCMFIMFKELNWFVNKFSLQLVMDNFNFLSQVNIQSIEIQCISHESSCENVHVWHYSRYHVLKSNL